MTKLQYIEEVEPITRFGASVTLPLSYSENGDFPWPMGSGTLVGDEHRLVLLTAAHLFDDCDINKFYLPSDRVGGRPLPVGRANLMRPVKRDKYDVAVLEFLEAGVRGTLLRNWGAASIDHIGPASADGTFFLFGYPSEKLKPVDKTLMCTVITACTERLKQPPANAKKPIDPETDLFFLYDDSAHFDDGTPTKSPHLLGASGGGIWEVLETPTKLWTASSSLRLVGIQSSTIQGEWFRAKSAELVRAVLQKA